MAESAINRVDCSRVQCCTLLQQWPPVTASGAVPAVTTEMTSFGWLSTKIMLKFDEPGSSVRKVVRQLPGAWNILRSGGDGVYSAGWAEQRPLLQRRLPGGGRVQQLYDVT